MLDNIRSFNRLFDLIENFEGSEEISIETPFDEDGEIDHDADNAVRKIARDRNLGITSDRELAFVAKDENGEIVGGAFTSVDQDSYTFDVVVSKDVEGVEKETAKFIAEKIIKVLP